MKRMSFAAMIFSVLLFPAIVLGGEFFERLDGTEKQAMMETLQYVLERNRDGEESYWANPETGNSGAVVSVERFVNEQGFSCRNFISTILINGEEERNNGTACRQEDGIWIVVGSRTVTTFASKVSSRYVYVYRDPYRYWYPWVYYAPSYYPHRIFFSFVFTSHRGYFHRSHFHNGRCYVGNTLYHSKRRPAPRPYYSLPRVYPAPPTFPARRIQRPPRLQPVPRVQSAPRRSTVPQTHPASEVRPYSSVRPPPAGGNSPAPNRSLAPRGIAPRKGSVISGPPNLPPREPAVRPSSHPRGDAIDLKVSGKPESRKHRKVPLSSGPQRQFPGKQSLNPGARPAGDTPHSPIASKTGLKKNPGRLPFRLSPEVQAGQDNSTIQPKRDFRGGEWGRPLARPRPIYHPPRQGRSVQPDRRHP